MSSRTLSVRSTKLSPINSLNVRWALSCRPFPFPLSPFPYSLSPMFTNTISNKWTETAKKIDATIELIIFNLGEVSLGIPMTKIDRVLNETNLLQDFSLGTEIEILDLHHRLFGISITNPTAMVIFREDKLVGIPIDTTPTLISVPLDRIRILPTEFRTNSPLGIASHVAITSIGDSELTIFIL
jgi:chemotaxis signal transduction protein